MRVRQEMIIRELGVCPTIDPEEEVTLRTEYLARQIGDSGLRGFVLGISGGQDSLLAGILAQRAVDLRRSEGYESLEFHAVRLPYAVQNDRADAMLACKIIDPDVVSEYNIAPMVDAFVAEYQRTFSQPLADFDKGNAKARARMMIQYAIAREKGLLVIGTDHAAEAVTGFYTKYGDGGADTLPLSGLTKSQGREMLKSLGVPKIFTTKAPTADLLDAKPGQEDETELGLSYEQIDAYLTGGKIEDVMAERIEHLFITTQHKCQMPAAYTDEMMK